MNISILYEDDHVLAINKPAGLLVHGTGKPEADDPSVVNWFLENYPNSADVGEPEIKTNQGGTILRPGIVHRLDRDTSGILLLAKTDEGHAQLKQQFQERRVQKTYLAWVYGEVREEKLKDGIGLIDSPIGRAKTFGKWTAIPKALRRETREAITEYKILEHKNDCTLLEVSIKTGRTHQIRVHMQYINHPVVADHMYAGKRYDPKRIEQNLGFTRQALHAYSITFVTVAGETVTVQAPKPKDFN